ncbi:MAG: hypothetical protein M2R46_05481 [Verrucomicrobia subdivision 3 bacterium]|nr:hypothetical protein [Limisphaerales bacterium]
MISRERSSCGGDHYSGHSGKPQGNEDTLKTEKIQVERKTFIFTLKENPRGRFLRITEDVGVHRDTIILPATGIADFKQVLDDMMQAYPNLSEDEKE